MGVVESEMRFVLPFAVAWSVVSCSPPPPSTGVRQTPDVPDARPSASDAIEESPKDGRASSRPSCDVDEVRNIECTALYSMYGRTPAPGHPECPEKGPDDPLAFSLIAPPGPGPNGEPRFDAKLSESMPSLGEDKARCCYSWCSPITIVEASARLPPQFHPIARIGRSCFAALEKTPSLPSAPFADCPQTVRSLSKRTSSGRRVSLGRLDTEATTSRRAGPGGAELPVCCYGFQEWVEVPPESQSEHDPEPARDPPPPCTDEEQRCWDSSDLERLLRCPNCTHTKH
jgi:hypothetical protein